MEFHDVLVSRCMMQSSFHRRVSPASICRFIGPNPQPLPIWEGVCVSSPVGGGSEGVCVFPLCRERFVVEMENDKLYSAYEPAKTLS